MKIQDPIFPCLEASKFNKGSLVCVSLVKILIAMTCLGIVSSCSTQPANMEMVKISQTENVIIDTANKVLDALKRQDGKQLAELVHPEKGVRFSPSAYIDLKVDRVFSSDQIENIWTDRNIYLWGYADGSGNPIMQTATQFWREYILPRYFNKAFSIKVNNDQASGNTVNNVATVYPTASWVEYYIKPSMRDSVEQLDWFALRLVFERVNGSWLLIGVILDRWTV